MTWDVPGSSITDIQQKFPESFKYAKRENMVYFDLNMNLPIFRDNPKLRQALTMAVDRDELTTKVFNKTLGFTPLYSTVTGTIENGRFKDVRYQWAKLPESGRVAVAQKLYEEAGYSREKPLQLVISYNTSERNKQSVLALAAMWQRVLGVKVSLRQQEWKPFIQARLQGDYMVAWDHWGADFNAVETYTNLYQCGSANNKPKLCDKQVDSDFAKAAATTSLPLQQKLYAKGLQQALDDYSIIPFYQGSVTRLVKPYIENYQFEENSLDHVQSKWFRFKDTN